MIRKMLLSTTFLLLLISNIFIWNYIYHQFDKTNSTKQIKQTDSEMDYNENKPEDIQKNIKPKNNDIIENDNQVKSEDQSNNVMETFAQDNVPESEEKQVESREEDFYTTHKLIDSFNGVKVHHLKQGQSKFISYTILPPTVLSWEEGQIILDGKEKVSLETDMELIRYDEFSWEELYRNFYTGSLENYELHTYSQEGVDVWYKLDSVHEYGFQKLKLMLYVSVDPQAEAESLYYIKLNLKALREGFAVNNPSAYVKFGNDETPFQELCVMVHTNEKIDND